MDQRVILVAKSMNIAHELRLGSQGIENILLHEICLTCEVAMQVDVLLDCKEVIWKISLTQFFLL